MPISSKKWGVQLEFPERFIIESVRRALFSKRFKAVHCFHMWHKNERRLIYGAQEYEKMGMSLRVYL